VMARVLSSLMRIFSCLRVDVWKFEPDMSRAFCHDAQPKDAANPDQGARPPCDAAHSVGQSALRAGPTRPLRRRRRPQRGADPRCPFRKIVTTHEFE
jgi:hypothetical protein